MKFLSIQISTIILALLIHAAMLCAAEGDTLWTRHYGGEWYEIAYDLCPTDDGGCVLAGYTEHEYAGPQNMYAVKVNASGDTIWSGEYGGDLFETAYAICPVGDSGFLLAGNSSAFGPWSDMYLVKTDADGLLEWAQNYGGNMYETAYAICPADDGGFLLAGNTGSFMGGLLYLVKVTASGVVSWSKNYSGTNVAEARCVIPSGDGGFLVAGYIQPDNDDVYLLRLDSLGDTLWTRCLGGSGNERAMSACQAGDGGFLAAGYTSSFGAGSWDMYLIRVNAAGDTLWTRTYGGPIDEHANAICPTDDGGFLLAGHTGDTASGYPDMYLVKIDASGDVLWTRNYGGYYEDKAWAVCVSNDGNYLLAGHGSPATGSLFDDMYLVKIEGFGTPVAPERSAPPVSAFALYSPHPNPFNPTTVLSFDLPAAGLVKLEVFDINGRDVGAHCMRPEGLGTRSVPLQAGTHQITFDGSALPSGIYLARLTAGDFQQTQKLILLK